jgi:hypothetical protein
VLVAGGEVRGPGPGLALAQVAGLVEQGGLEPGEREVEVRDPGGGGEREGGRIALRGELRQGGTAGVAEAEQTGALVERLAGGIVERLAQERVAAVVVDLRQQGVAAGRDQAHERRLDRVGLEEVGGDVTLEVVDGDQRQPAGRGQRLGGGDADEQRAHEAGALGDRDAVDAVEGRLRLRQRVVDDRVDELEVVARRDLRHHAAEAVVDALGGDDVGEYLAAVADDGGTGVVAGSLEREDHPGGAVRHMITASSPLSA